MSILSKSPLICSLLTIFNILNLVHSNTCGPSTCANFGSEYSFSLPGPTVPGADIEVGEISIGTQLQVSFDLVRTEEDITGNWRTIMSVGDDNYPRLPAFWFFPNDNKLHIRMSDSGDINRGYDTTFELDVGVLYQVVVEVCDGTVSSYVNNQLIQTRSGLTTTTATDQSIFIGRRTTTPGSPHVYDPAKVEISNLEIKPCVDTRPCSCASLNKRCRVSGDPHFTTWDGSRHHYQGGGANGAFYGYVTECFDDNGNILNNLPFNIVAEQSICNGPYTCVDQVLVELEDDNGPVDTISFPSSGIPTDSNGNDARGSGFFTFNGALAVYIINSNNFEISFENVNGAIATLSLGYAGRALNIRTCDCLLDQLCGICGTYNNDPDDDFTRCDDGVVLDNTGTSNMRSMSPSAWENTLEFGDSCCREDLDQNGICPTSDPDDVPLPDPDCTGVSEGICRDAYPILCGQCENDDVPEDEFVDDCLIDTCAFIDEVDGDIDNCNNDAQTCIDLGYLEDSENKCNVDCDEDGDLGTDAPTEEPTLEPPPLP